MSEQGVDVKSEQTVVDTSSVSEGQNTATTTEPSAETKKTEEVVEGQHVPYERFKEVNEKAKQAAQELEEYKRKADIYKAYEELDNAMQSNPVLNDKVNEIIVAFNKGELTKKEMKEAIEDVQSEVSTSQDPTLKEISFNMYNNEFMSLASKDFTDPKDIEKIGQATEIFLNNMYPNALNAYKRGLMPKAYQEAKKFLTSFADNRIKSYVSEKKEVSVPTSKPGAVASTEKEFTVDSFAESLKNAQK